VGLLTVVVAGGSVGGPKMLPALLVELSRPPCGVVSSDIVSVLIEYCWVILCMLGIDR
jgi:hypothetical protein